MSGVGGEARVGRPGIPRVGMMARVRNRSAIVNGVDASEAGAEGVVHLVTLEYLDADGPERERVLWEREPGARLVEPTALPDVAGAPPMPADAFDGLVRATRWTALTPYEDPDGDDGPLRRSPIASPLHGAVQVEDYQLVPLLRALAMPSVSLLLADDVGLGKTIEAGLIVSELILRRRIRRVLILTPASLKDQWRQEMGDKFSLPFEVVDRDRTHELRRQLGLDANPWRTFARVIASYYYLRQPDVLEAFLAASRPARGSPHRPWDLLVLDEAHNLAPSAIGEDSDLSKMLGQIAPLFEHRLFLTATPHNGKTRCFTGLLEHLDPSRFSRTAEMGPAERVRLQDVVVRRLKREINARSSPPRFGARSLKAIALHLGPAESALSLAFHDFRRAVMALVADRGPQEGRAGAFAVEVLGKRLLSCPTSFADSWHRYRLGMADPEAAAAGEVRAAERAAREEIADDREAESRTAHAARTVGAWLRPHRERLAGPLGAVDDALAALRLADPALSVGARRAKHDARFDALAAWIDAHLRTPAGAWRDDERLVVFTEYKATLDSLAARLGERYSGEGAIRLLYGGLDDGERRAIREAFNDPRDPIRVLVATDAASEGLNLQETSRTLLHFDIPWNPARLEQRNGRLDRHGQARDVVVHHFETDDDADLAFLAKVVVKVEAIREDLGATGEVFDSAFERRLVGGEDRRRVEADLDAALAAVRGRALDMPASLPAAERSGTAELERLDALRAELDLDPATLRDTLDVALAFGAERPRIEPGADGRRFRLRMPVPPSWEALIDEAVRLPDRAGRRGPLPQLTFDSGTFIVDRGGRPVYRPLKDTTLLHLGHPLMHRVLSTFARARFPGDARVLAPSRWTARRGPVPDGADAIVLLTVEELAVNRLREPFHHWVRTVALPVRGEDLGAVLPHRPAMAWRGADEALDPETRDRALDVWSLVDRDVSRWVARRAQALTDHLATTLAADLEVAKTTERSRFQRQQAELSTLIEHTTRRSLEIELARLEQQKKQLHLFDARRQERKVEKEHEEVVAEMERRKRHYGEMRELLTKEKSRIEEQILPARHALEGRAQVLPVAVEIRLPPTARSPV